MSGWLDKFALPAFFTLLGAFVSLLVTEWKVYREAKKRKRAFFHAVGMELDAVKEQLETTINEIDASMRRLQSFGTVRNVVFTSQLGKLRDVDDALLMEVIKLYSDLGSLEKMFGAANETSKVYTETTSDVQKPVARSRLNSALRVLKEQCELFLRRVQTVKSKLP